MIFSTWILLRKKYFQKDADWLLKNKGIEMPLIIKISEYLKAFHEQKYMTRPDVDSESFPEICQAALAISCFALEDLKKLYEKNGRFLSRIIYFSSG